VVTLLKNSYTNTLAYLIETSLTKKKEFYDVDARHAFEARLAASSPSMEAGEKKFYNFFGFVVIS
jgi:hypothetical protein